MTLERVGLAALVSLVAATSLLIGAWLGIYARPSQRIIAAAMAFGSGALIQALAVDLAFEGAERLIVHHQMNVIESWLYVAAGFALGGVIYYVASRIIENRGGALRTPATSRAYLDRNRHRWGHILRPLHLELLPRLSHTNSAHLRRVEHQALMPAAKEHHGSSAPIAIFFGALLDGIPESVVIGASFISLAQFDPTFVVAVFLSNLPEAMSSAAGMRTGGFAIPQIFGLWGGLVVLSAISAALGNAFLPSAPPTVITFIEALAGGGILAMLASTMIPEAFEEGGPAVGLSTIAGFLCAFLFTAFKLG